MIRMKINKMNKENIQNQSGNEINNFNLKIQKEKRKLLFQNVFL